MVNISKIIGIPEKVEKSSTIEIIRISEIFRISETFGLFEILEIV